MASRGLEYLELDDEMPDESFQKIKRGKKYESDDIEERDRYKKRTKPMHKNRHKTNLDE